MDAAGLARTVQYLAVALVGGSAFAGWGGVGAAWPRAVVAGSALAGAGGAVGWLALKSLEIADLSALPTLAAGTSFGLAALVRATLLLTAAALAAAVPAPRRALIGLGAVAAASFAWSGHGGAGEGWLLASDVIHALAATAWIGALPVLWFAARDPRAPEAAARALKTFSRLGPALVAVLTATGLANAWALVGPDQALKLGASPYGRLLLLKLTLFAGMLGLAAANRWRLTPALDRAIAEGRGAPRGLTASLALETALGAAVLAVVGWLGTLPPAGHGG